MDPTYVDYTSVKPLQTTVPVLDHGSVTLTDFHPRMCPSGYTPEYRIVEAARVSTGRGLRTLAEDTALIRYLCTHHHTSPLEMCSISLALKIPKAMAIQMFRHRTATFSHFNEFSQRYAECSDTDLGVYNPLDWEHGLRVQDPTNKQGSVPIATDDPRQGHLLHLCCQANIHQREIQGIYHKMIEAGMAREVARFWLPMSEYTMVYVQFDLNNLIKFLTLRDDVGAQREIVEVAKAIHTLAAQLFPTVFAIYEGQRNSLTLNPSEVTAIRGHQLLASTSKSEQKAFQNKLDQLGLSPAIPT